MLRAGFDSLLSLVLFLVFIGFAIAALVFAAMAREDAYRAAGKQTKKFWLILLGINLVMNLPFLPSLLFLQIAGLIAAIVFMVDVRPALAQVSGGGRGGRRGGGSSSDGPYGPYNGGR
ncbi:MULTISPECIES: DUF2516 family protein [unclassified Streptomyces]|uniref:DUF2516 family protein n=1 Tax=unclassified Streptomyces TaxID=2593676 RepID=UPI0006F55856|nr:MULTISPECIES: DUF2516 family protein [unclassified Streptomyces]KQX59544.1 hypothetical protein ASD33_04560 [Streptomyces sp. Root1304]KRB00802.1 hypothetical protein ASE09_04565 [Streptomyces sp. Root66D1]